MEEEQELVDVLLDFINSDQCPTYTERAPACMNGELQLPIVNGF